MRPRVRPDGVLAGGEDGVPRFSRIEAEGRLASLDIDRAVYDDIVDDPKGWSALTGRSSGYFE
jgi:hypothetical protein